MALVLRIRDECDVLRLIDALVESGEPLERADDEASRNEGRARLILSNRLADELEAAADRGVLR